jgi:hypothetical protein
VILHFDRLVNDPLSPARIFFEQFKSNLGVSLDKNILERRILKRFEEINSELGENAFSSGNPTVEREEIKEKTPLKFDNTRLTEARVIYKKLLMYCD